MTISGATFFYHHDMLMHILMNGSLTPMSLEMQVVVTVRYRIQYLFKGSTVQLNLTCWKMNECVTD